MDLVLTRLSISNNKLLTREVDENILTYEYIFRCSFVVC